MPRCDGCGTENALGRLFCMACGAKLDLSGPSELDLKGKRVITLAHLAQGAAVLILVPLLLGVVLVLAGPRTPLGEAGTEVGAEAVSHALGFLHTEVEVDALGRDFREADVNAYFRELRARKLGVESVSFSFEPERIRLRVIERMGPWSLGDFTLAPPLSRELVLRPDGAGGATVVKARLGRLPLPGPLRRAVAGRVRRVFAGEREALIVNRFKTLRAEADRVEVVVGR